MKENLYQIMYTSAWFFIGFFTMFLFDHLINEQYDRAGLDLFIILLNLYNQMGLWGRR